MWYSEKPTGTEPLFHVVGGGQQQDYQPPPCMVVANNRTTNHHLAIRINQKVMKNQLGQSHCFELRGVANDRTTNHLQKSRAMKK